MWRMNQGKIQEVQRQTEFDTYLSDMERMYSGMRPAKKHRLGEYAVPGRAQGSSKKLPARKVDMLNPDEAASAANLWPPSQLRQLLKVRDQNVKQRKSVGGMQTNCGKLERQLSVSLPSHQSTPSNSTLPPLPLNPSMKSDLRVSLGPTLPHMELLAPLQPPGASGFPLGFQELPCADPSAGLAMSGNGSPFPNTSHSQQFTASDLEALVNAALIGNEQLQVQTAGNGQRAPGDAALKHVAQGAPPAHCGVVPSSSAWDPSDGTSDAEVYAEVLEGTAKEGLVQGPPSEKKVRRMLSNRASAKRSRQRRQERLHELEILNAQSHVENAAVTRKLNEALETARKTSEENQRLKQQVASLQAQIARLKDLRLQEAAVGEPALFSLETGVGETQGGLFPELESIACL
eukprot:jgi/Mesen1/6340/ME000328S05623